MASHNYNPVPNPMADSVDKNIVGDDIMPHRNQLRAPAGGSDVIEVI
jgi:hypothetical protein